MVNPIAGKIAVDVLEKDGRRATAIKVITRREIFERNDRIIGRIGRIYRRNRPVGLHPQEQGE